MGVRSSLVAAVFIALALIACGPNATNTGTGDGGEAICEPACPDDEVCVPDVGCRDCYPERNYCAGPDDNQVFQCNADGTGGTLVEDCGDSICVNGFCLTPCERADMEPSNVGCHFWAVDMDNEAYTLLGLDGDAAAQQFAVAIANTNDFRVRVNIYQNDARYGETISESLVASADIEPNDLEQINLPQREIDGTMGQNGTYDKNAADGTFVSSHAYRIESDGPIVAYQFNPIINDSSNDASILIPEQALGTDYFVLGYPTSNPCGPPPNDPLHFDSVPDHTSVTIIGVHENTVVTVVPTHPIMATTGDSGFSIAETPAGTPLQFTIGPFDVVNLESLQPVVSTFECLNYLDQDGDFTGTRVTSTKNVVVFTGNERGSGFGGAEPPEPPGGLPGTCCTEHLEQQMFPTTALGWNFAISRSPVRSTDPDYQEPDIYRVMATVDGTQVTTNLPAPYDSFTLDAGDFMPFHAYEGFTVSATGGAIMVGQFLVSQETIPQGGIGDPTYVVFPAADQHRKNYVFLVPTTFTYDYMVLAMPTNAVVLIDGEPLGEFQTQCTTAPIGTVNGTTYQQMTCLMTDGVHHVSSDVPVGLTVYGYYNVGSYGYPGGSDVKIINPIE